MAVIHRELRGSSPRLIRPVSDDGCMAPETAPEITADRALRGAIAPVVNGGHRLTTRVAQLLRYGTVSLIATGISMTVLGTLVATGIATAGWANVIATAAGTGPSFELNRRWVWNKRGRRSVWTEVGPFCALSFTALALSTWAVSTTGRWAGSAGLSTTATTVAVEVANVAAFGSLWVVQFLILDRVLFHRRNLDTVLLPA